ncbi:TraB/GumN family protein [Nanoarchaeota archaeon]
MKYKNLTIIGTSHISIESVKKVEETIEGKKPDIVALELDKDRFYSLLNKKKGRRLSGVGMKGFLFGVIGAYVEKKLGKIVNVEPGSEMLAAIKLAKKHKIAVALIDQHISITLKRFSQTFSWKEKWNLIIDIFRGMFSKEKELEKIGLKSLDLTRVPEKKVIKKLIGFVKKRYPNIHNVLIKERNEVMSTNLAKLMVSRPKETIVAVIGAGHEEDILNQVKQKVYKYKKGT